MDVAVVGAGNGGLAVAGALGLAGHTIRLCDIREEALALVRALGGVQVSGQLEGFAPIAYAGPDLARAVQDAAVIMVVVPCAAHGSVADALAPYVSPGQVVVLHPGGTGGALEFRHALRQRGIEVPVVETDSFLYACRLPKPGHSHLGAIKARLTAAALPNSQSERVVTFLRQLFPQLKAASSVLETSLANMNAMLHVGPMLANVGRIQFSRGDFEFYGQGITPSVARLVQQADDERVAVCRLLGAPALTLSEWIRATYRVSDDGLYRTIQKLHAEVYKTSRAPATLDHRYLTEDVPAGLVPIESLGHLMGLPMRLTGALITVASLACRTDFRRHGRTADKMGLAGLDAAGILALTTN